MVSRTGNNASRHPLIAFLLALALALTAGCVRAADIAWVWHSSDAPAEPRELAVLLDHLVLSGDDVDIRRRMRPLIPGRDVRVTPVVHVQTDLARPPRLGGRQTGAIVAAMRSAAAQSTSGWVQLDFEAMQSQKAYYAQLIAAVRAALPRATRLSVTALASWCEEPEMLAALPVDEVVPMFFRMGAAGPDYLRRLQAAPQTLAARCRAGAAGFAVQEAPDAALAQRYARRYWFNYKNWDTSTTTGAKNARAEKDHRFLAVAGLYRTARRGGAEEGPAQRGQGRTGVE